MKNQSKLETMQEELTKLYPIQMLCELPDEEFEYGGRVANMTMYCGHHSGRKTIGGLGLWNVPARNLVQFLR